MRICIDVDGSVSLFETVGIEVPADLVVLCCSAGEAGRIAGLVRASGDSQAAVAARLEQLAGDLGITPHAIVVERAFAAGDAINAAIERLQATGGMKDINRGLGSSMERQLRTCCARRVPRSGWKSERGPY